MNVTFACPHCGQGNRLWLAEDTEQIECAGCRQSLRIPAGAYEGGRLHRCLACPSTDLYVRKDFPQRLGVALVAAGIIGSSVAWYFTSVFWTFAILFSTALIDFVLFLAVGDALMCYRCGAQYRHLPHMDAHGGFDLETHERHRQSEARERQSQNVEHA